MTRRGSVPCFQLLDEHRHLAAGLKAAQFSQNNSSPSSLRVSRSVLLGAVAVGRFELTDNTRSM
jgi:hypothetical protein